MFTMDMKEEYCTFWYVFGQKGDRINVNKYLKEYNCLTCKVKTSYTYGPFSPSFQSPFSENIEVVLYNKVYQG